MRTKQKDFNLKDKIALVTGATGHLGQEMAIGLASAGAHVMVNSRSKEKAKNVLRMVGTRDTKFFFIKKILIAF